MTDTTHSSLPSVAVLVSKGYPSAHKRTRGCAESAREQSERSKRHVRGDGGGNSTRVTEALARKKQLLDIEVQEKLAGFSRSWANSGEEVFSGVAGR